MGRTFAVSGFGRSGTKWLAGLLGRAPGWRVEHEPGVEMDFRAIHTRFAAGRESGNYGEVNSYLMPAFPWLNVDRKAIVLRHPLEIARSCLRQGHPIGPLFADHLNAWLSLMDACLDAGMASAFSFSTLTQGGLGCLNAMDALTQWLGIGVMAWEVKDFRTKVNASVGDRNLDPEERGLIERRCGWFIDKYKEML